MGLSLEKGDIDWFEDEECDDTRIRTIEAFEVEQQRILYQKLIQRNSDYNYAMHTFRALVTNYFPADYDYEAPMQTLRHRLYITLHAMDRRFTGNRNRKYRGYDSQMGLPCCIFCFPANPARQPLLNVSSTDEEGITLEDDKAIGALIRSLQAQSLQRHPPDPNVISSLHLAIGTLQPAGSQMRDLQFQNVGQNNACLRKALIILREIVQR